MKSWVQLIPSRVRSGLYLTYGVIGLILGGIGAYCAAVGVASPEWVVGVNAVVIFVGSAFGFVAAGNTDVAPSETEQFEVYEATDPETGETEPRVGVLGR